jgi:hypothetical protein
MGGYKVCWFVMKGKDWLERGSMVKIKMKKRGGSLINKSSRYIEEGSRATPNPLHQSKTQRHLPCSNTKSTT